MTSLFHARRSAEEFAAAVDGDRGAVRSDGATLLEVVTTLRSHDAASPRADFSAALRERLMLEAQTALRPGTASLVLPTRRRGVRERRLVAAASAFVLIGGTTTMAAAAQNALPGEALYPIKRGLESAEAGLSLSTAGKGEHLLSQASDRLHEVEGLLGSDTVQAEPRVPETLGEFVVAADQGATLLFESFRETGEPETVSSVRSFAAEGITTLEQLAGTVPPEAQDELMAAAMTLREIDAEAAALCGTCADDLPLVDLPAVFLARAEVDRALRLAAQHELNNDHAVEVPVRDLQKVRTSGGRERPPAVVPANAPTPQTTPQEQPKAPSEPSTLPSPTWEPESWPSLLPGIQGETSGGKTGQPGLVEKGVQDIEQSLNEAVETLLPDTDADLLD
jgi:hypothetical protein